MKRSFFMILQLELDVLKSILSRCIASTILHYAAKRLKKIGRGCFRMVGGLIGKKHTST